MAYQFGPNVNYIEDFLNSRRKAQENVAGNLNNQLNAQFSPKDRMLDQLKSQLEQRKLGEEINQMPALLSISQAAQRTQQQSVANAIRRENFEENHSGIQDKLAREQLEARWAEIKNSKSSQESLDDARKINNLSKVLPPATVSGIVAGDPSSLNGLTPEQLDYVKSIKTLPFYGDKQIDMGAHPLVTMIHEKLNKGELVSQAERNRLSGLIDANSKNAGKQTTDQMNRALELDAYLKDPSIRRVIVNTTKMASLGGQARVAYETLLKNKKSPEYLDAKKFMTVISNTTNLEKKMEGLSSTNEQRHEIRGKYEDAVKMFNSSPADALELMNDVFHQLSILSNKYSIAAQKLHPGAAEAAAGIPLKFDKTGNPLPTYEAIALSDVGSPAITLTPNHTQESLSKLSREQLAAMYGKQ